MSMAGSSWSRTTQVYPYLLSREVSFLALMNNHFINILLYLQIPSDVSQIFSDDACSNIIESVSMKFSLSPLFIYLMTLKENLSIVD